MKEEQSGNLAKGLELMQKHGIQVKPTSEIDFSEVVVMGSLLEDMHPHLMEVYQQWEQTCKECQRTVIVANDYPKGTLFICTECAVAFALDNPDEEIVCLSTIESAMNAVEMSKELERHAKETHPVDETA